MVSDYVQTNHDAPSSLVTSQCVLFSDNYKIIYFMSKHLSSSIQFNVFPVHNQTYLIASHKVDTVNTIRRCYTKTAISFPLYMKPVRMK